MKKITENVSILKDRLIEFQHITKEDFQVKIITAMARDFEKKFNADIGYASSAITPNRLSHGAIIFEILEKWFSQNGKLWNEKQPVEATETEETNTEKTNTEETISEETKAKENKARWYLQNPVKQQEMLEAINIKQRNVRGGFNFTSPAERTMKEIIKNELDYMNELPKKAIAELMTQLRNSYKKITEVCQI